MIFYLCFPFINMLAIKVLFCRLLFHQAYYVASRFCLLCLLCMYCLVCLRSCLLFVYLFVCLLFCLFACFVILCYLRRHMHWFKLDKMPNNYLSLMACLYSLFLFFISLCYAQLIVCELVFVFDILRLFASI